MESKVIIKFICNSSNSYNLCTKDKYIPLKRFLLSARISNTYVLEFLSRKIELQTIFNLSIFALRQLINSKESETRRHGIN